MVSRTHIAFAILGASLLFSSVAAAQILVGGQTVTDEDMPAVQRWCDDLAIEARTNPGVDNDDHTPIEPDEVDEDLTAVELSTITLDQCLDAGLVEGPIPLEN